MNNFILILDGTAEEYLYFLSKWFLIGLTLLVILMLFVGLMWYFRKIWNSRDDEAQRKRINSSVKWMVFSWIGMLTIDIALLIVFGSVWT